MFVGAYLCTGAVLLVLGAAVLAWRARSRRPPGGAGSPWSGYLLKSGAFLLAALVLFIALSSALGIMPVGRAGSWSYPQDYLAGGPLAWLVMLLPPLGLCAPVALALLSTTRSTGRDGATREV